MNHFEQLQAAATKTRRTAYQEICKQNKEVSIRELIGNDPNSFDGKWSDELAEIYFSDPEKASIQKLCLASTECIIECAWLQYLSNIKELKFVGEFAKANIDFGHLPSNPNREQLILDISESSFHSIKGLLESEATIIRMWESSISHFHQPTKPWGQKLQELSGYLCHEIDFSLFTGKQLQILSWEDAVSSSIEGLSGNHLKELNTGTGFLDTVYNTWKDKPKACFTAEKIMLNGECYIWEAGGEFHWMNPKTMICYAEDEEYFTEILNDDESQQKRFLGALPPISCTLEFGNVPNDTFDGDSKIILELKKRGYTLVGY